VYMVRIKKLKSHSLDDSRNIYNSWILFFCLNKRDEKSFYPCNINEKQISLIYALMRERYIPCTNINEDSWIVSFCLNERDEKSFHPCNINEKQISLTYTLMREIYNLHKYSWGTNIIDKYINGRQISFTHVLIRWKCGRS
jgi:hypothetical protein